MKSILKTTTSFDQLFYCWEILAKVQKNGKTLEDEIKQKVIMYEFTSNFFLVIRPSPSDFHKVETVAEWDTDTRPVKGRDGVKGLDIFLP